MVYLCIYIEGVGLSFKLGSSNATVSKEAACQVNVFLERAFFNVMETLASPEFSIVRVACRVECVWLADIGNFAGGFLGE